MNLRAFAVLGLLGILIGGACKTSGSGANVDGNDTSAGLTIDVTLNDAHPGTFGCGTTYTDDFCPTVTPNPASVKAGGNFRWANLSSTPTCTFPAPIGSGACPDGGTNGFGSPSTDGGSNAATVGPSPTITLLLSDGTPLETYA